MCVILQLFPPPSSFSGTKLKNCFHNFGKKTAPKPLMSNSRPFARSFQTQWCQGRVSAMSKKEDPQSRL